MPLPQFDRYKCPPAETMNTDDYYSISINPCDRYQWWSDQGYENRLKLVMITMILKLKRLKGCGILHLHTEVSPKGRIHFHGIVQFENLQEFFIRNLKLLQKYGTYEIDTIKDHKKWDQYIKKQHQFMKPVFKNLPFGITTPIDVMSYEVPKNPKEPRSLLVTVADLFTKNQLQYVEKDGICVDKEGVEHYNPEKDKQNMMYDGDFPDEE